MFKFFFIFFAPLVLSGYAKAQTELHAPMTHQMHLDEMAKDSRQSLDFPPPMKAHMLSNMRDHLAVISAVVEAISNFEYDKAARIANDRLGLDSPAADGCRTLADANQLQISTPSSMEQMMAQFMPVDMRNIGFEMHRAASNFAVAATESAKSGNPKPSLVAFTRVTQQCIACHSAYRLH